MGGEMIAFAVKLKTSTYRRKYCLLRQPPLRAATPPPCKTAKHLRPRHALAGVLRGLSCRHPQFGWQISCTPPAFGPFAARPASGRYRCFRCHA